MISVRNIYYLLLYAWDRFSDRRMAAVDVEPVTDLVSLFASVLVRGVDQLLRRGLDRGYVPITEVASCIRGKLNLSATIRGNLLLKARTVCEFDDFVYDVPHNQILKATLSQLLRTASLDKKLRNEVRITYRRLSGITDVRLSPRLFSRVQLHRNISNYQLLLNVCRLLYEHLIPDAKMGKWRFNDFIHDEVQMRRLFEHFLYNFYRHEQSSWKVRRPRLQWADVEGDIHLLPEMRTDIVLQSGKEAVIIDAKYTPKVFQDGQFTARKLRSSHLYQLFAYLNNFSKSDDVSTQGMLIYPLAENFVDANFTLGCHKCRVYTLDLNQHWTAIRDDLFQLVFSESHTHPLEL